MKYWAMIENRLQAKMHGAGEKDKRLAIQRGDHYEEVPAITVTVEAGWSK